MRVILPRGARKKTEEPCLLSFPCLSLIGPVSSRFLPGGLEWGPWWWRLVSMLRLGPHIPVINHLHTCDVVNNCSTFSINLKPIRHVMAPTTLNSNHTKRDPPSAQLSVDLPVLRAAR